jgi:cytoskeleton protein RodZ
MSQSQQQSSGPDPAEPAAQAAAIRSVEQLVQAREARGLAQADLAARLGMVPRQVQAMERGEWRALPGRSFARSALRAYGRVLGLNVEPLLEAIDADYGVQNEPINRPALDRPMPRRGVLGFSSSGSGNWLTWTVLIVVGLVVVAFFFGGGASLLKLGDSRDTAGRPVAASSANGLSGRTAGPDARSAAGSSVADGAALRGDVAASGQAALSTGAPAAVQPGQPAMGSLPSSAAVAVVSAASVSNAGSPPASALPTMPVPAAGALSPPSSAPVPAAPASASGAASVVPAQGVPAAAPPGDSPSASAGLVLRFSAESWIEVRDASDRVVLTGTQAAGTTRAFDLPAPLSATIGNAGTVQATWRGAPFDLNPHMRLGVARFRIERSDR